MARKIDEVFKFGEYKLRTVPNNNCKECFMYKNNLDCNTEDFVCQSHKREDRMYVIFEEVKE